MNCANCHAALDATTGWTQVGDDDPDYPGGTLLCMSRRCVAGSQRPAPTGKATTPAVG